MGWLLGWGYRKSHVINGVASGPLSDYCVRITAHKGAGVDSGEDVYLGANVRNDFGDVRFTGDDKTTLLDYWMETKVNGNYAVFWVEVDSIPASPNSATIYIYYAKSDAVYPYLSNEQAHGEATFPFFDNFSGDLSKWTILDGTWAIVAGELRHTGAGADRHIRSASYQIQNGAIEYKIKMGSEVSPSLCNVIGRMVDINNFYDAGLRYVAAEGKRNEMDRKLAGGWTTVWVACPWAVNTWYKAKFILYGNSEKAYINDVYEVTATWSDFASGYVGFKANMPAGTFAYIDDFRVRKYVSPEPTHGSWGSEETAPIPPPNKIDLRLSNVMPPDPDPPKTIYRDCYNLPATLLLGLTIRFFNFDDITLYFRVTGSAPGYTFTPVDLGSLLTGTNAYRNLDQFATRANPFAEVEEEITITLRAYTDAGYTNLRWTYERIVHVVIIRSNDPSYTLDVLNDFDDGTAQGWAVRNVSYCTPTGSVETDYSLSAPNSYRLHMVPTVGDGAISAEYYKSITTPNKDIIYAIINWRFMRGPTQPTFAVPKNAELYWGAVLKLFLGKPYVADTEVCLTPDKWIRRVIPLPKNETFELMIRYRYRHYNAMGATSRCWIDDFKIISK